MATSAEEQQNARYSNPSLGLLLVLVVSGMLLTVLFQRAGSVPHEVHHRYTLDLRGLREADAEIDAEVIEGEVGNRDAAR